MSKCIATTKDNNPCSRGRYGDSEYCWSHQPEEVKAAKGFGGKQEGSGRKRKPRVVDVIRELVEEDDSGVISALWDALAAERGVVVGNGPSAHVEYVPDHSARIAAAREILDRGYGKPKQQTELSGPEGGPVEIVAMPDADEWHRQVAAVLQETGALDARPDQDK